MKELMTKHFSKWASKQNIEDLELVKALKEVEENNYDASLGGHLYKKRIRFVDKGKSGSGRTIICYKKADRAIFIHGFAKNEKDNLTKNELLAFKEFAKVLLALTEEQLEIAINNGDLLEVKE